MTDDNYLHSGFIQVTIAHLHAIRWLLIAVEIITVLTNQFDITNQAHLASGIMGENKNFGTYYKFWTFI